MEELFDGQLSFTDIDAEKFLQVRRAHADRRVNAMDRLTDDVRKLFKTSIFERWGEAVLFKLRTPDQTLKSVESSHEPQNLGPVGCITNRFLIAAR